MRLIRSEPYAVLSEGAKLVLGREWRVEFTGRELVIIEANASVAVVEAIGRNLRTGKVSDTLRTLADAAQIIESHAAPTLCKTPKMT